MAGKVIEIAGLSGVGKSTTCLNMIAAGQSRAFVSPFLFSVFRKMGVDRLFRLFAALKFRRLLDVCAESGHCSGSAQTHRGVSGIVWQALKRRKLADDERIQVPAVDLLCILGRVVLLDCLTKLEVLFRNTDLVVDDGYMMRATSLWLRMPEAVRNEILSEYMKSVPGNWSCVFLDCSPEEALRRSAVRGAIRSAFREDDGTLPGSGGVLEKYKSLVSVFAEIKGVCSVETVTVVEKGSESSQLESVMAALERLKLVEKSSVWVCC